MIDEGAPSAHSGQPATGLATGLEARELDPPLVDEMLNDLARAKGNGVRAFALVFIAVGSAFVASGFALGQATAFTAFLGVFFGLVFGGAARVLVREVHFLMRVEPRWMQLGVDRRVLRRLIRHRGWSGAHDGRSHYVDELRQLEAGQGPRSR